VVLALDLWVTRHYARCDDHTGVALFLEIRCRNFHSEMQLHVLQFDLSLEVAQHLVKLFLAGNNLGHVELAPDLGCRVIQVDVMAAFGQHQRG